MNLEEAIQSSMQQLRTLYPEGEADAMTAMLMEGVSGFLRTDWRLKANTPFTPEQEEKLQQYTKRLLQSEPIQYVLGEAWFCGLKFKVDKRVLIPRPETEEMVEWIISHCRFPLTSLSILDIGSGSGCIPIALKRRIRKAAVTSIDLSHDALDLARENAKVIGTEVNFIQFDFLNKANWNDLSLFDLIVSNPPYVPESDKQSMDPNVLNHEPHLALFVPDDDALIFYKAIAEFGKTHLTTGGQIFLEMHESLGSVVYKLFTDSGFQAEIKKDMQGKERMMRVWNRD